MNFEKIKHYICYIKSIIRRNIKDEFLPKKKSAMECTLKLMQFNFVIVADVEEIETDNRNGFSSVYLTLDSNSINYSRCIWSKNESEIKIKTEKEEISYKLDENSLVQMNFWGYDSVHLHIDHFPEFAVNNKKYFPIKSFNKSNQLLEFFE